MTPCFIEISIEIVYEMLPGLDLDKMDCEVERNWD
jgi:hypothetical protein